MEGVLSTNQYWWKKQERVHETLFAVVNHLFNQQTARRERNIISLRLYGQTDLQGLGQTTQVASPSVIQHGLTLNVIESMVDTVAQKITKNKPKPMFLTSGGDATMQKRARLLNKFAEGLFYKVQMPKQARELFYDGAICDVGFLQVFRHDNEIRVERAFPNEFCWDEAEARYGTPRNKYRKKLVPRELLASLYPKYTTQIMTAKRAQEAGDSHTNLSTMIEVVEAWHLPSRKGAEDGRHCICIENADLIDEKWTRTYFPQVAFRWKKRRLGFSGQSLAQTLTGLQYSINKTLRVVDLAFHLLGIPKVFVESGSKIVRAHLNNEVGGIIEYQGTKPTVETFQVVPPQLLEHLANLYQKAYEIGGVSQLSAQSKKPAGLDSGKALREYNDIESERFITVGEDYEEVHLEVTRQGIEIAREIAKDNGGKFPVQVPDRKYGQKYLRTVNWNEIELDDSEYMMQCFPISAFSSHPSGRLQDIQEYTQAGMLTKEQGQMLMDFPDLEGVMSLNTAAIHDIMDQIEEMLEGRYTDPEPFQRLDLGISMVQSAYLKAKSDKVEEEKLELMRRWMEAAKRLLDQAAAPPPAPASAAPAAVPEAPPVSDLLPNAPGAAPSPV